MKTIHLVMLTAAFAVNSIGAFITTYDLRHILESSYIEKSLSAQNMRTEKGEILQDSAGSKVRVPKGFLDDIHKILGGQNLNMTNMMPNPNVTDIVKGAKQAVQVLDSLGLLTPLQEFIKFELEFFGDGEIE